MKLWRHFTRVWRQLNAPPHRRCPQRRQPRRGGSSRRQFASRSHGRTALRQLRKLFTGVARPRLIRGQVVAYHGTPRSTNAASIVRYGFMTGQGNGLGDGVYFARNAGTAKGYAGISGVLLKCRVRLGKTCVWDSRLQKQFAQWCQARGVPPDNSGKTAFLLRRGFDTIQSADVVVVLSPQYANGAAWKRKDHRIRVLSIHRASDGARVRV